MSAVIDPLAEAKALRPLVEAEADATDAGLTLSQPLVEAFAKSKLFHLMVPEAFGGLEADSDTLLDVFEELSHQDGSVGWTQMANASATSYVAFLDPGLGKAMLADQPESVFAGQFAPRGEVKRESGGYRVSGDFGFGSGSAHASYLGGAGMLFNDDGSPEILESGMPGYLCFFVPQGQVEFKGGWDVMGLRGTGSFDYRVLEQHVDVEAGFFLFESTVRTGGALYGLGATALAGLGHAGWGLGVAQRALDEIAAVAAGGRVRMGAAALVDQQVFQRDFGEHSLALRAVRLLVHDVYGRALERLRAGDPLDKSWNDEVMATVAYLTQIAEAATLFAYRAAGSQGLRNPSCVQRCFRDMFTGGLHVYVDRRSYEELARGRLAGN